jgi:hypothetical protein
MQDQECPLASSQMDLACEVSDEVGWLLLKYDLLVVNLFN